MNLGGGLFSSDNDGFGTALYEVFHLAATLSSDYNTERILDHYGSRD